MPLTLFDADDVFMPRYWRVYACRRRRLYATLFAFTPCRYYFAADVDMLF